MQSRLIYKTYKCFVYVVLLQFMHFCNAQTTANHKQIDSLINVLHSKITDTQKVALCIALSEQFEKNNDSLNAFQYAIKASKLAQQVSWETGIYDSKTRLGDYYTVHNNYDSAIATYKSYKEFAEKENDKFRLKRSYFNLAYLYFNIGKFALALEYYNNCMKMELTREQEMSNWSNVGECYRNLGNYTQALKSYEKALTIAGQLIHDSVNNEIYKTTKSGLLITVAGIYSSINEFDRALINYKKASETSDEGIKCYAYIGLGDMYAYKIDFESSIKYYRLALQASQKEPEYHNDGDILYKLAGVYTTLGKIDTATYYAQLATNYANKIKNRSLLGSTSCLMGKIYNKQNAYYKAELSLKQAISIAQETGDMPSEKDAWQVLSETYTALRQPAKAFEAYKQFITLRDTLYNTEKAKELTRIDMQGEFDRKQTADSIREADEKKIAAFKLQRQRIMSYSGFAGILIAIVVALLIYRNYSNSRKANIIISKANETINEEKQVSENLLLNILPAHVADELKRKGNVDAKQFDNVTILFTDFVNFTITAEKLTPAELVAELHTCFKAFDEIVGKYKIEKIKTVGDAYLAAAGLPDPNSNHAADIVSAAIEIRDFMKNRKEELGDRTFGIRLGVNSGTVVAGIVGVKKFAYDIWGDAVNTAARMEQNSEHFKINISNSTYQLIKDSFACSYRGEIGAKNKGMLSMYFVEHKYT